MTVLQFRGIVGTGNATFDTGISDLLVVMTAGGPMLVSVSGQAGGLVSYDLSGGVLPAAVTWRGTVADATTATGPGLVATADGLLVAGLDRGGVSAVTLSETGVLSWPSQTAAGFSDWSVITDLGADMLALADPDADGFAIYQWTPGGNLMLLGDIADTGSAHAQNIVAMDGVSLNGRDFVVVASASEQGISVYQVHNAQAYLRGTVGPAEGVGIMTPTALEIVETGGQTYVITASAPANDGASGALSVMRLGEQGQLLPTDHVLDTRDTRFGQVQDIAVAEHRGVALIATGGGDDGVTLLALTPSGQLVHLASFADTNQTGLTGVTDLEMVMIGDELRIFAASGADAGLTVLTADLSDLGAVLEAGNSGEALTGTPEDDILVDGAGQDSLSGGAGSDIFVMGVDGQTDRIMDFNPAQDVLDLSSWPLLYDVNEVRIIPTASGALVSARGEEVLLISPNRTPLTVDAVRDAIDISLNRVFYPPEITETGSSGADSLMGSWGMDRLSGGQGDDTLCGGLGDDTLEGGAGTDRAEFSLNRDDISRVWVTGDSVTIQSGEGVDVLTGIEWFAFADVTLSLAQVAAMVTPETVEGGQGNDYLTVSAGNAHLIGRGGDDTLVAVGGNDTLWGGDGNDDLSGGAGNDTLTGGAGNDVLRGGTGTDWALFDSAPGDVVVLGMAGDRATLQSADGIDVIDGIEFVRLSNSVMDFDSLADLLAATTVTGTNGNDALSETGNDAVIRGLGGADTLISGAGNDTLEGGDGNDVLIAAAGHDDLSGGNGTDLLSGGDGNDTLHGGADNDTLRGGAGTDRAVIDGLSTGAETLAISGNRATLSSADGIDVLEDVEWVQFNDRLIAFDQLGQLAAPTVQRLNGGSGNDALTHTRSAAELYGYAGDDVLTSGDWDDWLDGGSGNDTLDAGRGNDVIEAGIGDDVLMGMGGDDTLRGGDGSDTLKGGRENDLLEGGDGDDSIVGQRNVDTIGGGAGHDTLKGGGGPDEIYGEDGNDFIKGGTYADFMKGGMGDDTLLGNRHDDTLEGGWGHDEMNAGGDDDLLIGGGGNDWMRGGSGADVFVFATGHDSDVIDDFDIREDTLQIDPGLANGQTAAQIAAGASITGFGVLIDFGGGDTILLDGVYTTNGLAGAIDIA